MRQPSPRSSPDTGRWFCASAGNLSAISIRPKDAFQAVFLVLARRATSIRNPELLATWLHQVAIRTARKTRARHVRRQTQELDDTPLDTTSPRPSPEQQAVLHEQCQALHEEIDRLASSFRSVVVVCYLEGLTVDEAAQRLRCPPGTVRSRMARARAKLRRALTRRGIMAPAAAMAAAFAPRPAAASISPHLWESTACAALQFAGRNTAAGHASASASTLAHQVLQSMIVGRLRFRRVDRPGIEHRRRRARYVAGVFAAREEPPSTLTDHVPLASAERDAAPMINRARKRAPPMPRPT